MTSILRLPRPRRPHRSLGWPPPRMDVVAGHTGTSASSPSASRVTSRPKRRASGNRTRASGERGPRQHGTGTKHREHTRGPPTFNSTTSLPRPALPPHERGNHAGRLDLVTREDTTGCLLPTSLRGHALGYRRPTVTIQLLFRHRRRGGLMNIDAILEELERADSVLAQGEQEWKHGG